MPFYYDFSKSHDNAWLRSVRKIYRPLGFHRGYNFPLWIIFGGAIFAFGLARAMYLNINGVFAPHKVINGDWQHWQSGHQHVGIIMHLAAVIPICFLVPWQFLPIVRHAALWFHRINGYICAILLLVGNTGAFMIMRHSMGGDIATQVALGFLGIYTTVSLFLAYYNIKCLQVDQHRAWMLRAWIVAGAIITQRIIQIPTYQIMSRLGDFYFTMPCNTIAYIGENIIGQSLAPRYAECRANPNGWAAVNVNFNGFPEEIGASINASFAPSGYVALFLHILGVEMYLLLTHAERDRLKQVSYEKQVARGWMKRAGDVGLTPQAWGDLPPWHPAVKEPLQSGGVLSGDEYEDNVAKENDLAHVV